MKRGRHGFLIFDAVGGLLLVGAIALLLAVVATRQQRGATLLEHDRAATRLAEKTLLEMHDNGFDAAAKLPAGVTLRRLDTPVTDGFSWLEIDAAVAGRHARLIGLVPAKSAEKR